MRNIVILWITAILLSSSHANASDTQTKINCFESLLGKVRAHVLPASRAQYYASIENERVFLYVVIGESPAKDLTRYDLDLERCRVVEDMSHRMTLGPVKGTLDITGTHCPIAKDYAKTLGYRYFGHGKSGSWDYIFGIRPAKDAAKVELGILYRVLHADTKTCTENSQAFFELKDFEKQLTLRCNADASCSIEST